MTRASQSVASLADTRDRTRFVQDRSHSENLARLAEGRDRANFLENRVYEAQQGLSAEAREQSRFLENRNWTEKTAMDAELRQRGYQQADLEGARAYADPAAERARLEAAGFNPLGRADSSSGMNNIGGAIANAPAAMPSVGSAGVASFSAPAARAAEAMGMPGAIVPSAAGSASSQIARSQMAHMGVFDPAVAFMQAPIMQADNSLGEGLADAFASYESQKLQEKEFALRKSQLEIEQARMSELMQRATMRPMVAPSLRRLALAPRLRFRVWPIVAMRKLLTAPFHRLKRVSRSIIMTLKRWLSLPVWSKPIAEQVTLK